MKSGYKSKTILKQCSAKDNTSLNVCIFVYLPCFMWVRDPFHLQNSLTCKCICGIMEIAYVLTNATIGNSDLCFSMSQELAPHLGGLNLLHARLQPACRSSWSLTHYCIINIYLYINIYILLCVYLFGYLFTKIHNVLYILFCYCIWYNSDNIVHIQIHISNTFCIT